MTFPDLQTFRGPRDGVDVRPVATSPSTRTGSRAWPRPSRTLQARGARVQRRAHHRRSPRQASEQRAALAVFPELGLSAYAIDDLLHQSRAHRRRRAALRATPRGEPGAPAGPDRRRARTARRAACSTAASSSTAARCSGVVPKSYLPEYREYYEERQFRAAREFLGHETTVLGETVPFGPDLIFEATDLPRPLDPRRGVRGPVGPAVAVHLRRARRRDGAREPEREQHHGRQVRLPPHARRRPVGALHRRLHLHGGGPRRVDDRPRVGRPGDDLRERRPGRRGRALLRRRAAAARGHRPGPDALGPVVHELVRRLDRRPQGPARTRSAASRSRSSRGEAKTPLRRTLERLPYVPADPRHAQRALLRGLQHPGPRDRDPACARPGSRRP